MYRLLQKIGGKSLPTGKSQALSLPLSLHQNCRRKEVLICYPLKCRNIDGIIYEIVDTKTRFPSGEGQATSYKPYSSFPGDFHTHLAVFIKLNVLEVSAVN